MTGRTHRWRGGPDRQSEECRDLLLDARQNMYLEGGDE
jgi:hypothetical protein